MNNTKGLLFILIASTLWAATFTDLSGRRVEVPHKVNRIICTGPGALRLIVYLNAQDKVIGVEDIEKKYPEGRPYIIANPELKKLPTFAKGGPPGQNPLNEEEVLALSPQVIFAAYMDREFADRLQRKLKIPVIILSYGGLATFDNDKLFGSLLLAGEILGREERARKIVSYIKFLEEDLRKRTKNIREKPKVYIGGLGYKGSHGIDSTMTNFPVFRVINAENLTDNLRINGWISVDREKLLQWDPDYIFIDEGGLKLVMNDMKKTPSFYRSLKAFRKGKVYGLFPFNYYTTNIEIALANAYFCGKILYPQKFLEIDPEEKANEIFKFFVGESVYEKLKEYYPGFAKIKLIE